MVVPPCDVQSALASDEEFERLRTLDAECFVVLPTTSRRDRVDTVFITKSVVFRYAFASHVLMCSVLSNMAGLRQVQDCIELLLEEIRTRDTTHSHLLECVAPRPLALSLPTSHLHGSQPTCTPVPVLCFPRLHHGRAIHGLHHDQGRGCACCTQREAITARGLG